MSATVDTQGAAQAFCQGYNNWLYERYVKANPLFKGVALLPLQDVEEAVVELRRAVEQLGMVAAMLPSHPIQTLPLRRKSAGCSSADGPR